MNLMKAFGLVLFLWLLPGCFHVLDSEPPFMPEVHVKSASCMTDGASLLEKQVRPCDECTVARPPAAASSTAAAPSESKAPVRGSACGTDRPSGARRRHP